MKIHADGPPKVTRGFSKILKPPNPAFRKILEEEPQMIFWN